jgi:hypothetical protein
MLESHPKLGTDLVAKPLLALAVSSPRLEPWGS